MEENKSNVPEIKINIGEKKRFISLKILIVIGLIIVVGIIGYNKIISKKPQVRITTKVELVKVLDESKLNTARYYYNGIVTKENNDGDVLYYVSYEGTVTVGINFDEIEYIEDTKEKKIIVKIPELKITEVNVDATSLDFIKRKSNLKDENIHSEAYNLATEHLKNTINTDKDFYKKAKENTKKIVQGLIEPLIKAKNDEYKLEILDK